LKTSTVRLLDFLVSAAKAADKPTLVIRMVNESGTFLVDDELGMLPLDARLALKADDIAIIEFEDDAALESIYAQVQKKRDLTSSLLQLRADCIPTGGRPTSWNTPRW
jgi:hypothetical protein